MKCFKLAATAISVATVLTLVPKAHGTCAVDLEKISKPLTRAELIVSMRDQASEILVMASQLPAGKFDELGQAFAGNRVDKGHMAWRAGYQDGLKAANPPKSVDTPKMKPVPNKPNGIPAVLAEFGVSTVEELKNLPPEQKAAFESQGFAVSESVKDGKTSYGLDQNINQAPSGLNPALNMKLNGVHAKYAAVLVKFLAERIAAGQTSLSVADIESLSNQVHNIWMDDTAWKIESPIETLFGMKSDQFYGLNAAQRIEYAAAALNKEGVDPKDLEGLQQFRPYSQLSEQNQILDDGILAANIGDLLPLVRETLFPTPH